jgi:hypothetical protein
VTAPLLSASEMASLSDLVAQGMQTSIAIWRRSTVETDDGQKSVWAYSSAVMGWVQSTPTPMQTEVSGKIATVNTYRLFVPLGTDIIPGDRVVSGAQTFTVSDTTAESTWQAMLTCSLRLAE